MKPEFCAIMLVAMTFIGSQPIGAQSVLELFIVSPTADSRVRYGRMTAQLSKYTGDPDAVAHRLLKDICEPAILHSTSWRWEKDGTIVLTYLAFSEEQRCASTQPKSISIADLLPPETTDPLKPRPAEIRQMDVLAHGLRHITFLMRYSSDDRIRQAISPRSAQFFQGLCGQLAGQFDSAREFSDCREPLGSGLPKAPSHQ